MVIYWKFEDLVCKILGIKHNIENCYGELKRKPHEFIIFLFVCFIIWVVIRLSYGIQVANDPAHCRVRSIGDVIIAPMYTLGCNVGKDRFDIKVN